MNDSELIERLRKSDEKAFEKLFREYNSNLAQYADFYIGDSRVAEDIVQDLFFKLWERRFTLKIHTSLKSYLYRSVHNHCIQHLRHRMVNQKYDAFWKSRQKEAQIVNRMFFETGINNLFIGEINELVKESLEKLPQKSREIFLLSREDYMKNAEIGKELNLSEKSVEYHITKVLNKLREDLKDYLPLLFFFFL